MMNAVASEYPAKKDVSELKSAPLIKHSHSNNTPVKLTPPLLNASSNDVKIEEVELGHEGIGITSGSASKHIK